MRTSKEKIFERFTATGLSNLWREVLRFAYLTGEFENLLAAGEEKSKPLKALIVFIYMEPVKF